MSGGYVKVYRQLFDHWLWNSGRFSKGQAWVDLIGIASYYDHEVPLGNQLIAVKRGQVLTSQTRLAAKWLWTRKSVNAFLTLLKRDNQIDIRTSKETETGYTLITIKNYEKFQGFASSGDSQSESIGGNIGEPIRGTSEGHPRDTINKGKEGKEGKESRGDRVSPPLPQEIQSAWQGLQYLNIPQNTIRRYLVTYNGKIDLAFELRKADGWCQENPQRAPRTKHTAFMTRWLNRQCADKRPVRVPTEGQRRIEQVLHEQLKEAEAK